MGGWCDMGDLIKTKGFIQAKIKYKNTGKTEIFKFNNQVLINGRIFLANSLLESNKKLWIANMLFGDGGSTKDGPKEVTAMQDRLNGVVRLRKPVVAQIDPEIPTQVIFSIIIGEEECNGCVLNEMGLELNNESLFSLSTFSDLNKTDQMEIQWLWQIVFI
jgi:hypothetical protein